MKFIFVLWSCCFISQSLFAQENYDADLIPSNLKNRATAIIRNEEIQVDMQSPENVIMTVKKVITVLNKNGDEHARLVLFYDKNSSIKGVKGEVLNASGKLEGKFSQNDFIDASAAHDFSLFEDSRVKHYLPSVSVYPYTIIYNYELRFKQNLIIPDWVPKPASDVAVEKSNYVFLCNPAEQLRIQNNHFPGTPEESSTAKQKRMSWTIANIPASKPEPFSPDPESYQTSVKIAAQAFSYYKHNGQYSNWKELGKWVYDDLLKSRSSLSPYTVETIKSLIKNESTDLDKARKIYQYMQDKTRYISVQIGIGGLQPIAASEVDRVGYGDCKALVNYMQSLLQAAGIESYYCVVEAGSTKKGMDPNYASMVQGNHVILCMPLKGDTTWLECTNQKIPFGYLGDFTDDRLVLACTPEGGKLLRTPKLTAQQNLQVRNASFILSSTGSLSGQSETTFQGAQYDNREDLIGKPFSEQQKLLKETYDVDNIDFTEARFKQDKGLNPKVTETLTLNITNYAPLNNDKLFLQVNPFNIRGMVQESKNRTLPLYINRGYTDEDTIVYQLPAEVVNQTIPDQNKTINTAFGSYEVKVVLKDKKLTYYRKLVLNDGTFRAEQYAEFSKFLNDVYTEDHLKLVLSLKK